MVSRVKTLVQHPPKMRAVVVTGSIPGIMLPDVPVCLSAFFCLCISRAVGPENGSKKGVEGGYFYFFEFGEEMLSFVGSLGDMYVGILDD